MEFVLGLLLILLMGLSLGLLGGGGSILAVPILHYVLGQSRHHAIAFSLVLVGSTAILAALLHHRDEQVDWRCAGVFGILGAPASFLFARVSNVVDGRLLFFLFGLLMLLAGGAMLRPRPEPHHAARKNWLVVGLVAGGLGALTGFLGVGGGFLIVPALVLLIGLPIRRAVGTSLVVIALNAAVGAAGKWQELDMNLSLLAALAAAALAGTFAGVRLSARFHPHHLRRTFGIFVLVIGLFMLAGNWPF